MKIIILFLLIIISFNNLFSQFNGTYIIGGPNGVYPLLSLAIQAIEQQGVTGPVTFKIYPGNYPENVRIQNIPGNSITNIFTIESTTGNPEDVIFEFTPTNSAGSIFWLNNAKNMIIKNITLKNLNNYYKFLTIDGQSKNTIIQNLKFIGKPFPRNINNYVSIENKSFISYESTVDSNRIIIQNCKFYNGFAGIGGILNNQNSSVTIMNNSFSNLFVWISYNKATSEIKLINNIIQAYTLGHFTGFDCGTNGKIYLINNTFQFDKDTFAITINGLKSSIYNNCFSNSSFYIRTDTSILFNNTIKSKGITLEYDESKVKLSEFKNNILISDNSEVIYELPNIFISDNNCFKSTNDTIIKTHFNAYTLSMWQNAMNKDLNSSYGLPLFSKSGDYHIQGNNPLIIGKGTPIAEITHDIDGDLRDINFPCIGADEFTIKPILDSTYKACFGSSKVLDAGSGFQSYLWSNNATTQTISVPSGTGLQVFSCTVGFNGQFGSASTKVNWMNCTGIEQSNIENQQIIVYPNPTKSTLTLQSIENQNFPNGILQIYNIQGKKVKETKITKDESSYSIDVSCLSKGLYLGRIIGESGENWSFKFVKE